MSNAFNVAHGGDTSAKLREWSSLIGIVTAIVGNVLISFALNIQRYAHIRLDREQDGKDEQWSDGRTRGNNHNYGTQQIAIVEERAQLKLSALSEEERTGKTQHSNGNGDSGISAGSHSLHSRSFSDSTINHFEKLRPQADRKTYLRSGYWWAGLVLMIIGEAGNFIAYGFAPASIVSPLGVVALVSNCIIAPVLLKEHFRQRDFWGVAIAIAGAVTIVLSAKNSETKMGPHDVWTAITRWEFETYLGVTAALVIILMCASEKYGERTVLIDLGLVALFGKSCVWTAYLKTDRHMQEVTLLYPPKVLRRCSQTLSGALLHSPSPILSSLSSSLRLSFRYVTSTELYNVSTRPKSSLYNSCSLRYLSSSEALYSTATSNLPTQTASESFLRAAR